MVLIATQAGDMKYVLESTDKVIYLSDFALVGLGSWTSLYEQNEAGAQYVVPAGKTLTIVAMTFFSSNVTGYIDMKFDTVVNSAAGTRFSFPQNIATGTVVTVPYKIDIPAGNYVNIQKVVAQINIHVIGIEHDA